MIKYDKYAEYNAFGPWVYEIGADHALPPLFAPHCGNADDARLLVKIPRHIERRSATPDMHLYDSVVGVMDDHLLILERDGDTVNRQTVAFSGIQAIEKVNDLLSGQLHLYMAQRVVTINYNTVSDNVMSRIAAMIRGMWAHNPVSLPLTPMPYDTDTIDYLYVNLIRRMQKDNPSVRLLAYQPQLPLSMHSLWQRIIARLTHHRILQCTAYLADSHELITIRRSASLRSAKSTDYMYSYTYVPLMGIIGAQITPHPKMTALKQIEYLTTDHTFTSVISDENSGVEGLCKELAGIS